MEARNELKKVMLSKIDFSGYDNKDDTLSEVFNTFIKEYMHPNLMRQVGGSMPKAVKEWLQGLPTCIDMPFYTFDIVNLMYALGYETEQMDQSDIDSLYWLEMATIIYESAKVNA